MLKIPMIPRRYFALAFARSFVSSLAFSPRGPAIGSRCHQSPSSTPFHALLRKNFRSNQTGRNGAAIPTRLFSSLERTDIEKELTNDALVIVTAAINAVDPYAAIRNQVSFNPKTNGLSVGESVYLLEDYDNIVLVAFGKASSAMATAVIEQLENNGDSCNLPIQGVIVTKDDHGTQEEREFLEAHNVKFLEASHPVPDARSTKAAKEIVGLVADMADNRTLVISCISGGGSALFCFPQEPLTLEDLANVNSVLLSSGLDIKQMNVIRKRLENGKGGRLAASAYPSRVVSLVLSDVLGDPLDLIASGPTVPDTSTFEDAWRLVDKHNLQDKLPPKMMKMLEDGLKGLLPDSPSAEHPAFAEGLCKTVIVGNNELAVIAAAVEAERLGYNAKILGTRVEGEAKYAANFYASMVQYLSQSRNGETQSPFSLAELPVALIAGGETTVSIPQGSKGKGGRNQELALAAALEFQALGLRNVVLASVGTDGTDGPTDAAGAVVDGATVSRLAGSAEDALLRHDAYTYLDQLEEDNHTPLIKTGPTGTNVADVCVVLVR